MVITVIATSDVDVAAAVALFKWTSSKTKVSDCSNLQSHFSRQLIALNALIIQILIFVK